MRAGTGGRRKKGGGQITTTVGVMRDSFSAALLVYKRFSSSARRLWKVSGTRRRWQHWARDITVQKEKSSQSGAERARNCGRKLYRLHVRSQRNTECWTGEVWVAGRSLKTRPHWTRGKTWQREGGGGGGGVRGGGGGGGHGCFVLDRCGPTKTLWQELTSTQN